MSAEDQLKALGADVDEIREITRHAEENEVSLELMVNLFAVGVDIYDMPNIIRAAREISKASGMSIETSLTLLARIIAQGYLS